MTATRGSTTYPVGGPAGLANTLRVAVGYHDFAASDDEAGDVFRICSVPAGATVIGGYLQGKDLDTGTEALDIDVGWIANGVEALDADGFGIQKIDTVGVRVREHAEQLANSASRAATQADTIRETLRRQNDELEMAANTLTTGRLTVVVFYVFL